MINAAHIPLKKKIALNLFGMKRRADALSHPLRYLFWECTLRCNMNCLHCGSDCTRDAAVADMPAGDFLQTLDQIAAQNDPSKIVVAITGGEPLMREDLADVGRRISSRGFSWGIVTNGYLLDSQKLESLVNAGIRYITISLDGLEADHVWMRGKKESYARACKSISLVAEAGKRGLHFDIVTCVNQRNIRHLNKLKDRLLQLGAGNWRIATIFPKGRAAENTELQLTSEQLRELMDFITATREEGRIEVSYGCDSFLGGYEMEIRNTPFFCWAGINIGSVLVDGSISACPSLRADYIQGNIYRDSFMDVWNGKFQVMRNRKWLKTGECADCKRWNICMGNGLHLRREKDGKLLSCHYKTLCGE